MTRKIPLPAFIAALTLACGADDVPSARPAATVAAQDRAARPVVLFFGTSLTAGNGVEPDEAFPAIIRQRLDSAGLAYDVVNGGESGATSAGGVRRIDWFLRLPVTVLVLELGANDGLRGQDVSALRENLQEIIDRTRAQHPNVRIVIAGMEAPPNLGAAYTDAFRRVFIELSERNGAAMIPFLLDGVGGHPELNQADGIHPTAEGHRVIADNVWPILAGEL